MIGRHYQWEQLERWILDDCGEKVEKVTITLRNSTIDLEIFHDKKLEQRYNNKKN